MQTDEEKIAARMIPMLVIPALDTALPVDRRMRQALGFGISSPHLGGLKASECRSFCDGQRSVLDIRNAVSAELGAIPIGDVIQYFYDMERQGVVVIARR